MSKIKLEELSQKTLVDLFKVYSENTTTVDSLWFRSVAKRFGTETAEEMSRKIRERYGVTDAIRLKRMLGLPEEGGIPALVKALNFHIWIPAMEYEFPEVTEKKAVFNITDCFIRKETIKDNGPEFRCEQACEVQYVNFAKTIDPRIEARCLLCRPEKSPEDMWCSWEFLLNGEPGEKIDGKAKIDYFDLSVETLSKLIRLYSKSVITIDGLWFINLEEKYNIDLAIELDVQVWEDYGTVEAKRLMKALNIAEGGGIPALVKALNFQIWVPDMECEFQEVTDKKVVFNITDCTPQKLRLRDNRGEFACKPVGVALFNKFAEGIDPRLSMRCLVCPPDKHPDDLWCSWEFRLEDFKVIG